MPQEPTETPMDPDILDIIAGVKTDFQIALNQHRVARMKQFDDHITALADLGLEFRDLRQQLHQHLETHRAATDPPQKG